MNERPSSRELAHDHADVANALAGAAPSASVGSGAGERGGEHGLRRRTGEPGTPGGTPPDRNTRFVETSRGILSYAELAPLLGERVLACEEAIVTGLGSLMVGAFVMHLKVKDPIQKALPSLAVLAMCAVIALA